MHPADMDICRARKCHPREGGGPSSLGRNETERMDSRLRGNDIITCLTIA